MVQNIAVPASGLADGPPTFNHDSPTACPERVNPDPREKPAAGRQLKEVCLLRQQAAADAPLPLLISSILSRHLSRFLAFDPNTDIER